MTVHRIGAFLALKQRAAVLKLSRMSLHCSAVYWKKDESDLMLTVSENIMAAGSRYLKGDKEELRENLKKRNYNLSYNFNHMVEFVALVTLYPPQTSITPFFLQLKLYADLKMCRLEVSELRHKRNVFTKEITKRVVSFCAWWSRSLKS